MMRFKSFLIPFLVFFLSLAGTVMAWRAARSAAEEQLSARFEKEVDETLLLFSDHLELYFDLLYSARSFFLAAKDGGRGGWAAFNEPVDLLARFPGILSVQYIKRVGSQDVTAFTEETIADKGISSGGYPGFKIYPEGGRKEYYVTHYFAPYQENIRSHGFDVLTDPVRREGFERARDTGQIAVTGIVQPPYEANTPGNKNFMIVLPVYKPGADLSTIEKRRKALIGFAAALCNIDKLLGHIFKTRDKRVNIDFDIFDGMQLREEFMLSNDFRQEILAKEAGYVPHLTALRRLDVGGRIWTLQFITLPEFRYGPIQKIFPPFVLGTGVVFSLLLLGILTAFSTSELRAVKLPEAMTDNLRVEIKDRKKAEEEVRQALRIKSEFLSIVSHELRTPLTAIGESLGIVSDGSAGPVNPEQKDFLETAKRNVGRLSRLINDVLDFQKLEAGRMEYHFSSQALNPIIEESVKSFQPAAQSHGVAFSLALSPGLPPIQIDKDRIYQVLANLIDNAIKFSGKGRVHIKTEKEGQDIRISVRDEGIGVRKEDMHRLFQSFSQISSEESRKTGGTGLGLVISKQIIEAHGGRITVDSVFGRGTTFTFWLPAEKRNV